MEYFTDFYTDNETGQPVRFKIDKYDINFTEEYIKVYYFIEIFNAAQTKLVKSTPSFYIVKDSVREVSFAAPTLSEEPLATPFSDWIDYMPVGVTMIQLFVGSTLPKILLKEGVS